MIHGTYPPNRGLPAVSETRKNPQGVRLAGFLLSKFLLQCLQIVLKRIYLADSKLKRTFEIVLE
jgi:hypothetical protein